MHQDYLRRAREGKDPDALARLIELDQKEIYHFMKRRLGHLQDAEDATQETFRQMLLSLRGLRDEGRYRGWLYRIALRVAQSAFERRALERRVQATATTLAERTGSMRNDEASELSGAVQAALDRLDDDLRAVVHLRYEQGLRYDEIAQAIDRPEGTVAKRLHTAHQKLLQTLTTSGFTLAAGALAEALGSARPGPIPPDLSHRLKDLALRSPGKVSLGGIPVVAVGLLALLVIGVPIGVRWSSGGGPTSASETRTASARSPRPSADRSDADVRPPAAALEVVRDPAPASEPLAHVRGCVRDRSTHLPILGAEVWIEPLAWDDKNGDHPPRVRETKTGPDGLFAFDVPAGSYAIDALAPGYVRFRAERGIASYSGDMTTALPGGPSVREIGPRIRAAYKLDLLPGGEAAPAIDLLSASEIRVQVVDGAGRPVPDAEVVLGTMTVMWTYTVGDTTHQSVFETLFEPDGRTSKYRTDLQGRVTISNVYPDGTALLSAAKAGYETQKQALRMNGPIVEATMVLLPGISLAGRVLNDQGEPIRGACVFFLRSSRILKGDFRDELPQRPALSPETLTSEQSEPLLTKADGAFRAVDQASSFTLLAAFAPGWAPQLVRLSGPGPGPMDLVLSPAADLVTGTVTDQTGQILEGVSVAVHRYEVSQGDSQVQLVFRDERGNGWADGGTKSLVAFLPESFRPPGGTSQENGGFRLEGVAMVPGTTTYLEFRKEGYESETVEVPPSGEVRARLQARK